MSEVIRVSIPGMDSVEDIQKDILDSQMSDITPVHELYYNEVINKWPDKALFFVWLVWLKSIWQSVN